MGTNQCSELLTEFKSKEAGSTQMKGKNKQLLWD
jgi:hypothetical protein